MGKEFQVETTRLLKKFLLMSVLFLEGIKFLAYAVLLVGLTTFSPTNVNQVEKSTLSIPRRILNTWDHIGYRGLVLSVFPHKEVPVVQQSYLLLYAGPFLADSMPGLQIPGGIERIVYKVSKRFSCPDT